MCKGCVDLDKMVAFAVVFADALITLGIVAMVYFFAKKKAGSAPPQRGNAHTHTHTNLLHLERLRLGFHVGIPILLRIFH